MEEIKVLKATMTPTASVSGDTPRDDRPTNVFRSPNVYRSASTTSTQVHVTPSKQKVDVPNIANLSPNNTTPTKMGYSEYGTIETQKGVFKVYKGPSGGYSYFEKTSTVDGRENIEKRIPTAKHMETLIKFAEA